jgi:cytidine deaminase
VGAAVETIDGQVYVGCNVENSSYGLSICAERQAIGAAVAAGHRQFKQLAIAASPLAAPCGACRQTIIEFGVDLPIISVDAQNSSLRKTWTAAELLPEPFDGRTITGIADARRC